MRMAHEAGPTSTEHAGLVSRAVALVLAGLSALVVLWAVFALVSVAGTYGNIGHGWGVVAAGMALVAWTLALGAAALATSPVSTRLLVIASVLSVGTIAVAYLVIAVATGAFGAA